MAFEALLKRLENPPFGTDTNVRGAMTLAAMTIRALEKGMDEARAERDALRGAVTCAEIDAALAAISHERSTAPWNDNPLLLARLVRHILDARAALIAAPASLEVGKVLRYYAETFCEGFCKDLPQAGTYHESMDDQCSGCKARAALIATPASETPRRSLMWSEIVEAAAHAMWRQEAARVGTGSVAAGRTREAFLAEDASTRTKWRELAEAAVGAMDHMMKGNENA